MDADDLRRMSHMNPNGYVLGTSGSGTSFDVKAEMADMFLDRTFDETIVLDPGSLGERAGSGSVKPDNAVMWYMSVSATQRAGCMRAAPIRRSCPHTPMYVGLIVPSSCLTTAGTL